MLKVFIFLLRCLCDKLKYHIGNECCFLNFNLEEKYGVLLSMLSFKPLFKETSVILLQPKTSSIRL